MKAYILLTLAHIGIVHSEPESHGFTINSPGQVSSASFIYGADPVSAHTGPQYQRDRGTPNQRQLTYPSSRRQRYHPAENLIEYQPIASLQGYGGGYAAARPFYGGPQKERQFSGYQVPRSRSRKQLFANPTIKDTPAKYSYSAPQSRSAAMPSSGYTVNAPGFTKHKTYAGPAAVHGTNMAFHHASAGVRRV